MEDLGALLLLSISRVQWCWICQTTFDNRTDLNRHLTGKTHTRLAVICPWCLGKEKTFTRINDLKQHVSTTHKTVFQTLPSSFFTTGAGFFLAKFPSDYRRIVQVSPYDNEECFEARKVVLCWCASQLNAVRVSQTWRNAWLQEKAVNSKTINTVKRPAPQHTKRATADLDMRHDPQVYLDDEVFVKRIRTAKPLEYTSESSTTSVSDSSEDVLVAEEYEPVIDEKGDNDKRSVCVVAGSSDHSSKLRGDEEHAKAGPDLLPNAGSQAGGTADICLNTVGTASEEASLLPILNEPATGATGGSASSVVIDHPAIVEHAAGGMAGDKYLQQRAEGLLRVGQMPLCAPARRDWNKGGLLQIDIGGTSLT